VALQQGRREPVVVLDLRLLALVQLEVRQRPAYAQLEVLRRLVVNVRQSTLPGSTPGASTAPVAASARYTTRAAITEVLPLPAPATST